MNTSRDQHDHTEHLGVVVGVDGSRIGLDAVRWAVAEARLLGLPLQILHAAPSSAASTAGTHRARDILARAFTVAHRADPSVQITTRRAEHTATASLLDAARRAELPVGAGRPPGPCSDRRAAPSCAARPSRSSWSTPPPSARTGSPSPR
jgi:nucleotide-binding universal stress UspA family protein